MRTLDDYVATSIDGRIAADDGSFDHFLFDEKHVHDFFADLEAYGTVVMGRATYEVGLAAGKTNPYPWLEEAPPRPGGSRRGAQWTRRSRVDGRVLETVVYSKSLGASPDEAVQVVADDAVASRAEGGGRRTDLVVRWVEARRVALRGGPDRSPDREDQSGALGRRDVVGRRERRDPKVRARPSTDVRQRHRRLDVRASVNQLTARRLLLV